MKLYLSGPMTGIKDHNFPAFHVAAAALRELGFEVVSPAELTTDTTKSWHDCLRVDIKALCDCDGLVLLTGWENSAGAHLELNVAHRLGLRIGVYLDVLSNWSPE